MPPRAADDLSVGWSSCVRRAAVHVTSTSSERALVALLRVSPLREKQRQGEGGGRREGGQGAGTPAERLARALSRDSSNILELACSSAARRLRVRPPRRSTGKGRGERNRQDAGGRGQRGRGTIPSEHFPETQMQTTRNEFDCSRSFDDPPIFPSSDDDESRMRAG